MEEKQLAAKALEMLKKITDLCESDGPVFRTLEECRWGLEEIIDEN